MSFNVRVHGLKEFRKGLRATGGRKASKAIGKAHRDVARFGANKAKSALPSRVRKSVLRARGNQQGAFVDIVPRRGDEVAVVMGAKRRFGWYRNPRYADSAGRQFNEWVGNQWVPGERGGKPYFIGDALNAAVPEAEKVLLDAYEQAAADAYPTKTRG